MKFLQGVVLGVGISFALAASSFAQDTIKVGTILPLSGGAGPQGQHVTNAIKAMASIINEDGGVMGKSIEIVPRDDESTPAVGVSRASDLISEDVAVILEGWNSPVTLAIQPVTQRAGVLDLTIFSSADSILDEAKDAYPVRMNSSNAQSGAIIADYIANIAKADRVAFLTENDAYGNGTQESIENELKKLDYQYNKVAEEKFPFDQADFRVALSNIKAAKPDVTVAINANEGLGMPAIIRQARQGHIPGELVAAVGTIAPSVIEIAGDAADGVIGADLYFPDLEPFKSNPVNQRFIEQMKSDYDLTPDKFMALGAAVLQVWAQSVNELNTLDRVEIAKHIRGGSFKDTVMGDISFAPNGQMKSNLYLFTVKDGQIVVNQ